MIEIQSLHRNIVIPGTFQCRKKIIKREGPGKTEEGVSRRIPIPKEVKMEKVPQKLDKTRATYYKDAPIAKFGERKPPTTGMGRKIKSQFKYFR